MPEQIATRVILTVTIDAPKLEKALDLQAAILSLLQSAKDTKFSLNIYTIETASTSKP